MSKRLPTSGSNPFRDNSRRRNERQLDRICQAVRITSSKGRIARKRKKYVHRVERANYRELIVYVAKHLAEESTRDWSAA